jgi:hypothetical protein
MPPEYNGTNEGMYNDRLIFDIKGYSYTKDYANQAKKYKEFSLLQTQNRLTQVQAQINSIQAGQNNANSSRNRSIRTSSFNITSCKTPVEMRQAMVDKAYVAKAKLLDKKYHPNFSNIDTGSVGNITNLNLLGPFSKRLKEFGRGRVRGLIFGPFAEVSSDVEELITFLAQLKAQRLNEGTNGNAKSLTSMIKKTLVLKLGLFVHRSWARCLIERVSHPGIIDYHSRNLHSQESLDDGHGVHLQGGHGLDMQQGQDLIWQVNVDQLQEQLEWLYSSQNQREADF